MSEINWPRVFYIGDSTVQCNRIDTWPQCGMGQVFSLFLRPEIRVFNHARNGRSTKSFYEEDLWLPVENALRPGDFLLIQFGHNDEKSEDATRYTTPAQYADNLSAYAQAALAKGALPVLITPLTRRQFVGDMLTQSHGAYPDAVRHLAAAEHLPLIDLTAASRALVERLGEPASRALYMFFPAGQYANYPEGKQDNTHLRSLGAVRFCGLVAGSLRGFGSPYADVLLPGSPKQTSFLL